MFGIAAVLLACLPAVHGDPQILLNYRSTLASLPADQGWDLDARCLKLTCPQEVPPAVHACYWQGNQDANGDSQPDNDCTFGVGCHTAWTHYNSPTATLDVTDGCSYTEWLTFDDGNNAGGRLTIPDSSVTDSPPWGAPWFVGAPATHAVLRIATGDGNYTTNSLPVEPGDDRNTGKVRIRKLFTWPNGENAVTVVARLAAGPLGHDNSFLELRSSTHRFAFAINGEPGSPDRGRIGYRNLFAFAGYLGNLPLIQVTEPGMPGPHAGEFFTFRAVCRLNGTFTVYLNESMASASSGSVSPLSSTPELAFGGIATSDECVWVDYVRLYAGEVLPLCVDPVFDVNRDGQVNELDFDDPHGVMACMTGPAAGAGLLASLSSECQCLDVNGDSSVDMLDFAAFQRCLSPASDADPACDD